MNRQTLLVEFACEPLDRIRGISHINEPISDLAQSVLGKEFDHCAQVSPNEVRIHLAHPDTMHLVESSVSLEQALDEAGIDYCGIDIEMEREEYSLQEQPGLDPWKPRPRAKVQISIDGKALSGSSAGARAGSPESLGRRSGVI